MILTRYCLAFLFVVFAIIFGYIAKSILIIGIVVIYIIALVNYNLKKTPLQSQGQLLRSYLSKVSKILCKTILGLSRR